MTVRVHAEWCLPFDRKTAEELGVIIHYLVYYCHGIEGDAEGVVLECESIPENEIEYLKSKLKHINLWTEEE